MEGKRESRVRFCVENHGSLHRLSGLPAQESSNPGLVSHENPPFCQKASYLSEEIDAWAARKATLRTMNLPGRTWRARQGSNLRPSA